MKFQLFSDDELDQLHEATLEVLETTGVEVREPEALSLLESEGVAVKDERVRIGSETVEWALETAPTAISIFDRDGEAAMELTDYNRYFGTGSDTECVIDPETHDRKKPMKSDVGQASLFADALENIDFVMSMGNARDVPAEVSDVHHFQAMVENTDKPIIFTAWNLENLKTIVEMASVVAGGREKLKEAPFFILYAEPSPPLQHSREALEKLLFMAEEELPIAYVPATMQGATGPVTIAGSLVQANAEVLSGLVISQLKREGAPFLYGGGIPAMDMSSAIASYTAPESMLGMSALAEMTHYYDLPLWSYGGCTDSEIFDEQAAAEGVYSLLLAVLHGGNIIHDVGYMGSGMTTSYEMLVFADEMIGMIKRLAGGVEVSSETLALDVIDSVGPGGDYLGEKHTMNHFRENWFPDLVARGNYDNWEKEGSKSLSERANEKALDILNSHEPPSLEKEKRERLEELVSAAEGKL